MRIEERSVKESLGGLNEKIHEHTKEGNPNAWRSRSIMTLKTEKEIKIFFQGRDASLKLFNSLCRLVERLRSPKIVVNKTQISFGEDYQYLWVWLPQTWIKQRRENSITLTIVTGKRIKSDKIEESVQPKKGYWTHHIIIENRKDIDRELVGLIQESFKFYEERLKDKKQKKAGTSKKAG